MNTFRKITLAFSLIICLGGCSSKEVTPEPILLQPKTLTIVNYDAVNPVNNSYTWGNDLVTSYTTRTLNTATGKDFIRKYDITRNDKKLIESILYTYEGGGFPDGSSVQTYTYNTEKNQINSLSTNWTYNKSSHLSNLNYGSRSVTGFIEYTYDNANLLTKLYWKEGSYLDNTNTINSFTTIENPLYKIAKSLQFLNVTYNNVELIMMSSMFLPKSYNNGAVDNFITYELDAQNRVTSTIITNNGIVLKKYSFTY
jgi:hypothetical protein